MARSEYERNKKEQGLTVIKESNTNINKTSHSIQPVIRRGCFVAY